ACSMPATMPQGASHPVGKVVLMDLGPLTFAEFLRACGMEHLADWLAAWDSLAPLPAPLFNPLAEQLRFFLVTGGMPEPVRLWAETGDPEAVVEARARVLRILRGDFALRPGPALPARHAAVWDSLPRQLMTGRGRFSWRTVREGARAEEYDASLLWLKAAGLVRRIFRNPARELPLAAYDDFAAFRVYPADAGLFDHMAGIAPAAVMQGTVPAAAWAALAETFVLQALSPQLMAAPRFWSPAGSRCRGCLVVQWENTILPVAVDAGFGDAGTGDAGRTLAAFRKCHPRARLGLRLAMDNLSLAKDVLTIPLFMADQTDRLIGLALERPG
ncbi:MAG: hypothetical protein Q4F72_10360, partial [Desulfovibrionaceae bacterium]|nr:hypothetical protein [Desulfovibrionaceae bacterium]